MQALEDRRLFSTYTAGSAQALIASINSANSAGGTHTIILSPGATFELKRADNTTNGGNALPVIGGTKAVNLTIIGNGDTIKRTGYTFNKYNQLTNPFRLLNVATGGSLTLDHVKLQGGWADGSVGGAVYNQGTLNVRNSSTFYLNIAGDGGVIYNAGGAVTVSDTVFLGGGEQVARHIAVASNCAQRYGGAIYNGGGTVSVSNSSITGSSANSGGGAIYNGGGTLTVSNSVLSAGFSQLGGGICNVGGVVSVSNSTLSGNTAAFGYNFGGDGGAIYNSGGTLSLSNSTLFGNTAGNGGGIYNGGGGSVTIRNSSTITGNTANSGADVYNFGVLQRDGTSTIGILAGNTSILI